MPIQIDRSKAHDLTPRWDEALELVRNEFEGLDPHRQYRNAFGQAAEAGYKPCFQDVSSGKRNWEAKSQLKR